MAVEAYGVTPIGLQMAVELDMEVMVGIAGGQAAKTTTSVRVGLSTQGGDPGDIDLVFD